MVSNTTEGVRFGLLLIRSFPLLAPHYLQDAAKFNLEYPDPSKITRTADKLRWYRYRKTLLQREVADYAGIDRSTYMHYEEVGKDYYPVDKLGRIAELLEVDVTELMDDYNLFLYQDQGRQLCARREALGLTVSMPSTWVSRRTSSANGKAISCRSARPPGSGTSNDGTSLLHTRQSASQGTTVTYQIQIY